jgi:hypothetical protein
MNRISLFERIGKRIHFREVDFIESVWVDRLLLIRILRIDIYIRIHYNKELRGD